MKDLKLLIVVIIGLIASIMLSSCGVMKNNDFSSQKYTHFKKGESIVNLNQNIKEKKHADLFSDISVKNEIKETEINNSDEPSQGISTNKTEIKKEPGKTGSFANIFLKETKKIKMNRAGSLGIDRMVNKAKTSSMNDNDINLLLLVILAILLPPLAVFLVRGIGGAFWLDLLLTIFFWLPGMIYALIVIFGD